MKNNYYLVIGNVIISKHNDEQEAINSAQSKGSSNTILVMDTDEMIDHLNNFGSLVANNSQVNINDAEDLLNLTASDIDIYNRQLSY